MTRSHWFILSLLGISLTGCVEQSKYDALKLERDTLREQLTHADNEATSAKAKADALSAQQGMLANNITNGQGLTENLKTQNDALTEQLNAMSAKYEELLRSSGRSGGTLPPQLTSALSEFAAQNPDLVDFDAARGMVKFKSDVTFALGSADLTPKAREVISRFAQILNSPAANGYELFVAGHTDSKPVTRQDTILAGNKDNWYLSAHRAIAVGEEMQRERVDSRRIGVVGYADQRPISSDPAQNRRVEVLILPTTIVARGNGNAQLSDGHNSIPKNMMNKDTVGPAPFPVKIGPKFNKD